MTPEHDAASPSGAAEKPEPAKKVLERKPGATHSKGRDGAPPRTKGAMAAERASAGLGTSDDDSGLFSSSLPLNI